MQIYEPERQRKTVYTRGAATEKVWMVAKLSLHLHKWWQQSKDDIWWSQCRYVLDQNMWVSSSVIYSAS